MGGEEQDNLTLSLSILDRLFVKFTCDVNLDGKKIETISGLMDCSNYELIELVNQSLLWINGVLTNEKKSK